MIEVAVNEEDDTPQIKAVPSRPKAKAAPPAGSSLLDLQDTLDQSARSLAGLKRNLAGYTLMANIASSLTSPDGKTRVPGLPVLEFAAPFQSGTGSSDIQKCCLDLRDVHGDTLVQLVTLLGNSLLLATQRELSRLNEDVAKLNSMIR